MDKAQRNSSTGLGVDIFGGPVIDPTANVLALVLAAVTRLDDLRSAAEKLQDEKVKNLNAVMQLRAEHQRELDAAESRRIDSNRNVDIAAVNTAYDRAVAQASVLAAQLTQTTETMRNLITQATTALAERIATLEKSSYVGSGKAAISDPQIAELISEMRAVRLNGAGVAGVSKGGSNMWGYIAGAIGILLGVMGIITWLVHTIKPVTAVVGG